MLFGIIYIFVLVLTECLHVGYGINNFLLSRPNEVLS